MSTETFELYQDAFNLGFFMQNGHFEPASHLLLSILNRLGVRSTNIDVKTIFQGNASIANVLRVFLRTGYSKINGLITTGVTISEMNRIALIFTIAEKEDPINAGHDIKELISLLIEKLQSQQVAITVNWFFRYPIKDFLLSEISEVSTKLQKLSEKDIDYEKLSNIGYRTLIFTNIIIKTIQLGIFLSPENLLTDMKQRVDTKARISSLIRISTIPVSLFIAFGLLAAGLSTILPLTTILTEQNINYLAIGVGSFLFPVLKIFYDRTTYSRVITELAKDIRSQNSKEDFMKVYDQFSKDPVILEQQERVAKTHAKRDFSLIAAKSFELVDNKIIDFLIGRTHKISGEEFLAIFEKQKERANKSQHSPQ
ncbi:MAG: hypothetical protein ACTSW1_18630 [Candidatus Hodarchaeales archaeon]